MGEPWHDTHCNTGEWARKRGVARPGTDIVGPAALEVCSGVFQLFDFPPYRPLELGSIQDSNPQPNGYESKHLPLGPRSPLKGLQWCFPVVRFPTI